MIWVSEDLKLPNLKDEHATDRIQWKDVIKAETTNFGLSK